MNRVNLVGRICRDPEIATTGGQNVVARLTVAVNRRFKNNEGKYDADFIGCVAFGKTAEFISKYFKKGSAIGISGNIRTGSYVNKDGKTVYTTDVVIEDAEFVESKGGSKTESNTTNDPGFVDFNEDLPFN